MWILPDLPHLQTYHVGICCLSRLCFTLHVRTSIDFLSPNLKTDTNQCLLTPNWNAFLCSVLVLHMWGIVIRWQRCNKPSLLCDWVLWLTSLQTLILFAHLITSPHVRALSSYHIIYNDEEMEMLKCQNHKWCMRTLHKDTHSQTFVKHNNCVLANELQFPGESDPLTLKFRTMTLFFAPSARSKTVSVLNISLC